jgi:hypothetical protein
VLGDLADEDHVRNPEANPSNAEHGGRDREHGRLYPGEALEREREPERAQEARQRPFRPPLRAD